MYEVFGYIASVFATFAFAPQVIKTIKTKKTRDLSLFLLILSLSGNICWLINGYGTGNNPLIFSGLLISFLLMPLFYYKIKNLKADRKIKSVEELL